MQPAAHCMRDWNDGIALAIRPLLRSRIPLGAWAWRDPRIRAPATELDEMRDAGLASACRVDWRTQWRSDLQFRLRVIAP